MTVVTTDASQPRQRIGIPNPWLPQAALLEDIVTEAPGVATYRLRFVDAQINAGYRYRPGQFNMIYVPGVGEAAISISGGSATRGDLGTHHPCCRQCDARTDAGAGWNHHRAARALRFALAGRIF